MSVTTMAMMLAAMTLNKLNGEVVVRTPQGTVQGVGEPDGSTGGQAFYGMRYATQPARFRPSVEDTSLWKEKVRAKTKKTTTTLGISMAHHSVEDLRLCGEAVLPRVQQVAVGEERVAGDLLALLPMANVYV